MKQRVSTCLLALAVAYGANEIAWAFVCGINFTQSVLARHVVFVGGQ
jgi:hypothetical protein